MFEVGLDRLLRGRPVWRRLRTLYLWTTLVRPACLAWRLRAAERAYAPDGEGFASVMRGPQEADARLDAKANYFRLLDPQSLVFDLPTDAPRGEVVS